MLNFYHIAIQTFRPCKVLTRRDQLKLKESKIAEKEEAKKAKAASKPAAKRKAKAKAKALAKAEEDEASEGGENEDEDVEPMAKPKARGRKRKGNQHNDENAVEEEQEPKKPKKKAQPKVKSEQPKSCGRAKAKPLPKDAEEEDDGVVPSQPELDSDMKVDEVKHEAAPKKAPKRKAKAPKTEKLENTDAEMDEPVTPKKRLAKPCPWARSLRRTRWLIGRSHGQSRPRQRHQSLLLHQPQTARRRGRRNSNSAPLPRRRFDAGRKLKMNR